MSEVKRVTVSSRRPLRSGEWACVDAKCAHINAEKRVSCEICGKSKPRSKNRVGREIGKDAADKSKGLFSADDWVCTKCGNVNWARRSVCNVCNAPKLADLEVRTGYGGGYMDRQDVEYIEREDNEEFDEFGRKKKRQSKDIIDKNTSVLKEDDARPADAKRETKDDDKMQNDDVENDEEDDDSDNGDLDKYDLSADPELVSIKLDPTKLVAKSTADDKENDSEASSNCSCSCSGGECSCEESDGESFAKKSRLDDDKIRSTDRQDRDGGRSERRDVVDDRHRGRHSGGDRWRDCPRVRSREHSRERHHSRDREWDRHRDRDYRR